MQAFLLILHVLMAVTLIALVLIQHGRGADAGAAFGSGASGTVFGSRGSASFLTRATTFLAIGFFANSLALAYLSANQPVSSSLMDRVRIEEPADAGINIPLDVPVESSDSSTDQGAVDVPVIGE
jgi:preprotein translocase subunit SecG